MSPANDTGAAVVANPGGLRWLRLMATGLARAGLLRAYMTPVAASEERFERRIKWMPRAVSSPVEKGLRRRPIPSGVNEERIERLATIPELLYASSLRLPGLARISPRLGSWRSGLFDGGVSRRLRPSDQAVVVESAAALKTLTRARELSIKSFLDHPIIHHRVAAEILEGEARREPEFAPTLQYADLDPVLARQLDDELRIADRVFAMCSFHRWSLVEGGVDESKIIFTPLGVDLDLFRPHAPPEDETFRVLFVGQLSQRKGLSYLLEAFSMAGIPNSELLLHGRIVARRKPWEGQPGVRYVPLMPYTDLPALYASCDVFVLPSLAEGFAQTPLEAMACGRPVIISEHTFADDVIADEANGFIVPIRDSAAIADRLRQLHADPELRVQVGEAARRRAEHFSWRRYQERVVSALTDSA